ncbi:MAG: YlbF family regulator [Coprobacillus sp.]|nr:YlbF family regulator [Coprobacillus sp.]
MNKLTRIEELARKLNQEILALEVVQEYQKYEKLVLNDEKLKQLEKELKVLQKKIVNQKAKQDDRVTKTIQEYQEKKAYYENHPLVVNYLYLQNGVNEILQTINQQMNNALK